MSQPTPGPHASRGAAAPSSPTAPTEVRPEEPGSGRAPEPQSSGVGGFARSKLRKIKLRHLLFALLLLPGILPLLFSSVHLLRRNQDIVKTQQSELLTNKAQAFVGRLSEELTLRRVAMQELGHGIVAPPGLTSLLERLEEPWVTSELSRFYVQNEGMVSFNALDTSALGVGSTPELSKPVTDALRRAFDTSLRLGAPSYIFTYRSGRKEPAVAMAVPIPAPAVDDTLVLQALVPLDLVQGATNSETDLEDFFLIDENGELLWTAGRSTEIEQALLESEIVADFARGMAFSVTGEHTLRIGDQTQHILARIVPVQETGWGVVAHKPAAKAFELVRQMVRDVILWSAIAVVLALFFAAVATRWFSRPIQRLAETSHEIAAGKFDRRVPVEGLVSAEIGDMATDFNRMSDYVEKYIEQLRRAAEANRSLFISSIRAFAAAIDAKDPYTRGHSERVAAYSRSIARYLGLPKDTQEKVWIAAVLHDVGKIGVQDAVLQKHGVLTPEEFDQMKLHPVIGADIVEPISALQDMIPGIRWHHEAWNGTGYPDRLKGDQIPLMARVIGVADTFDAITTNRPYQTASSPEYAIETIKKLTGTKFDAKVVTAFLLAWEAGHIQLDRQRAERSSRKLHTPETSHAVAT